ncbi:hypothetical protein RIF29_29325 [Crotalaria pallida]|uniref:Uncharacterized protein n=1 Tax=Crotalaria pallida TaxID=3830 RepID=A0AAN9EEU1_CROPI
MPRDQCMSTTFSDWREYVEHVTTAFPLTCESEDQAILNLYIERKSILEEVWVENELLGRMGKSITKLDWDRAKFVGEFVISYDGWRMCPI